MCMSFVHAVNLSSGTTARLATIDANRVELSLPSWQDVQKVLSDFRIADSNWPTAFREMLQRPQCLKVFYSVIAALPKSSHFVRTKICRTTFGAEDNQSRWPAGPVGIALGNGENGDGGRNTLAASSTFRGSRRSYSLSCRCRKSCMAGQGVRLGFNTKLLLSTRKRGLSPAAFQVSQSTFATDKMAYLCDQRFGQHSVTSARHRTKRTSGR